MSDPIPSNGAAVESAIPNIPSPVSPIAEFIRTAAFTVPTQVLVGSRVLPGGLDFKVTTANTAPDPEFHLLRDIPGLSAHVLQFAAATCQGLTITVPRGVGCDLDIAFAIFVGEATKLSPKFNNVRFQEGRALCYWRKESTASAAAELHIGWPQQAIGNSLTGTGPGIHEPALAIAFKLPPSGSLPVGTYSLDIDFSTTTAGRGIYLAS